MQSWSCHSDREEDMKIRRKRILLDPNLGDGETWTVIDDPTLLPDLIETWVRTERPGARITIGLVALSDEEIEALPSV
jgi:hypothetical protein